MNVALLTVLLPALMAAETAQDKRASFSTFLHDWNYDQMANKQESHREQEPAQNRLSSSFAPSTSTSTALAEIQQHKFTAPPSPREFWSLRGKRGLLGQLLNMRSIALEGIRARRVDNPLPGKKKLRFDKICRYFPLAKMTKCLVDLL